MITETPAKGILKINDWGHSKMYRAVCECGDDTHNHVLDIEADDHVITVSIHTNTKTDFWSRDRWAHIFKLLFTGYVSRESSLLLSKQAALNYASVLQSAISDVENFRQKQYDDVSLKKQNHD